jgi:hypothetical protein
MASVNYKGMKVVVDKMKDFQKSLEAIQTSNVLVGIPSSKTARDDDSPLNNAQIGYLQEMGEPGNNLPARPFLVPGVKKAEPVYVDQLKYAMTAALTGDIAGFTKWANAAGLTAASSVRSVITAGIDPQLAQSTLRARAKKLLKHKDKATRQAARDALATNDFSGISVTPLIDTGSLLKAITYVLRRN